MTYDELNEYIKHYIEKDKTQSAIMLTGAWGTGKSYYIRNVLEPYLKANSKHRCAIVSLYGLKNTSEISKHIYFELRTIGSSRKSEAFSTTKAAATIIAKTVLNGMTNMIGFDIGKVDDEDLEKVYSSIDLSNTLVVFEDLERSNIDIIDILGYVNSLTEQDGAKVLLVANENEILKFHLICQPEDNGQITRVLEEEAVNYLRAKEKTISDTVEFEGDTKSAVENIILSFKNPTLTKFLFYIDVFNLCVIFDRQRNYNLRTFTFACQKTIDIFDKFDNVDNIEDRFIKTIFYGVVIFLLKCNNIDDREFLDWEGSDLISTKLGSERYPLYYFCYKYIVMHQFDKSGVKKAFDEHDNLRLFQRKKDLLNEYDVDLDIISNYKFNYEEKIMFALNNIQNRLSDSKDIPFYKYKELAYYLIKCNSVLGFDYSTCKSMMINNIIGLKTLSSDTLKLFSCSEQGYKFENEDEKRQFTDFFREIPSDLIIPQVDLYSYFDKKIDTIYKCSPKELYNLQSFLFIKYRFAEECGNPDENIILLEDFKARINANIEKYSIKMDKIQKFHIRHLIDSLTQCIDKLAQLQNE